MQFDPQNRAWQRMLSGRRLDLLNPSPLDIEIEDIAHGLARVARWNGQTVGTVIFSVAQHSLLVELIVRRLKPHASKQLLLTALLHDAAEFVIGDLISPFKSAVGGNYKTIEAQLEEAVHRRFGLPPETAPLDRKLIKRADMMSAYVEATQLAGFSIAEAGELFTEPTIPVPAIAPQSIEAAKQAFLERFDALSR